MMLVQETSLRLVVLNACDGGRIDFSGAFRGVAQKLVQMGVPAVVAMQMRVTDGAALTFARVFYETLAGWSTIDEALARSRHAMMKAHGMEWGAPVLFLRSEEGGEGFPPPLRLRDKILLWLWRHKKSVSLAVALLALAGAALYGYRRYARFHPSSGLPQCASPKGSSMIFLRVPISDSKQRTGYGNDPIRVLRPLCVGQLEVREKDWKEFLPDLPNPARGDGYPVTGVSYERAQDFIRAMTLKTGLTIRLPWDGEWEYVTRAGRTGNHFFGDDEGDLGLYGNCGSEKGDSRLAPSGSYAPNPWGFFDLYGNVQEWVMVLLKPGEPPRWLRRGGSYRVDARNCNSRMGRWSYTQETREDFGFRIVYEPRARLPKAAKSHTH